MGNMSYCRFRNTLSDLQDCKRAMDDGLELSKEEQNSFIRMVHLCREIAEEFEGMDDDELRELSKDQDDDDDDDEDDED